MDGDKGVLFAVRHSVEPKKSQPDQVGIDDFRWSTTGALARRRFLLHDALLNISFDFAKDFFMPLN